MTMVKEAKTQVIDEFKLHDTDSGSPEVQVALLTKRISEISDHLKTHKKDYSSRRGLLKLVGRRSALLKYLVRNDKERYQKLIERLGLRK
ncbi:MAG: 30S ribosomal protein S15 [Planctomycetes bacterium]|nr:30S ribosomal protein S15 [Planctomycetota bacterium]